MNKLVFATNQIARALGHGCALPNEEAYEVSDLERLHARYRGNVAERLERIRLSGVPSKTPFWYLNESSTQQALSHEMATIGLRIVAVQKNPYLSGVEGEVRFEVKTLPHREFVLVFRLAQDGKWAGTVNTRECIVQPVGDQRNILRHVLKNLPDLAEIANSSLYVDGDPEVRVCPFGWIDLYCGQLARA